MFQKLFLLSLLLALSALIAYRLWRYARFEPAMPSAASDVIARELHLTAAGAYTLDDIEANGRMMPSAKYRTFQARHDLLPQKGDPLCPITRTKANPECTWTIGGRVYPFCCPPCIDEFVRLARDRPQDMQPPEAFVKQ